MEFSINFVSNEFNTKYKFDKDVYLKYPGFNVSIDELLNIPRLDNKILLHGIIPSSGSIFDERLCDNMDNWLKIFKENDNKWVSLHFYYDDKYCKLEDAEKTCLKNITKIREALPDIPIIIENVPYQSKDYHWCFDPNVISEYCNKFDLGFLLDISHMCVYSGNNNLNIDEYLSKLPLDRLYEIHLHKFVIKQDGKFFDSHFECEDGIYELYEKVLRLSKNVKMTTIEFPVYNPSNIVTDYLKTKSWDEIYKLQIEQLNEVKRIANNIYR